MDNIRVVVADDHPGIRAGLQGVLLRAGDIQVVGGARDGQEAIALVKQLSPDILILDLNMPIYNGLQVIRRLHDDQVSIRLLVVSMYLDKATIQELLDMGIRGYIAKDEAVEWLVPAIREIMQGKQCLSPLVIQYLSNPLPYTSRFNPGD